VKLKGRATKNTHARWSKTAVGNQGLVDTDKEGRQVSRIGAHHGGVSLQAQEGN
jgi:hypothetical protein